ncbi:TetR/AcrR family transcriptional regulator [Herpetosiphon geysericola]|uniref:HTH tetR-type domain-containing protein n=1 Tax=Herpetosiphon geysericola TaxID=70996 RepID=A0A0P6YCP0_9CHLR|nr:TetR/AcrR family transcriptional regulator [Herpetosiphon geysericola]KPL88147.1 hypothetical protein SE18_10555 [Herpetosiphon geysericola]
MQSNKPRGRPPRTFTEEARRTQLIDCAIQSLAELGYVKTSLAQIATRAAISTSVVSYYFAGKDDLLQTVLAAIYAHAASFMEQHISPTESAITLLQAYLAANLAYGRDHPTHVKAAAEILTHWQTEPDKLTSAPSTDASLFAPIEAILTWGQEQGVFRAFDPRPMAITIRAAIDQAFAAWLRDPSLDKDQYSVELIALFDHATRRIDITD